MEEKIIGLVRSQVGPVEYVSLKFEAGGQPFRTKDTEYFSIVGSVGYIMSEENLNALHDEYIENLDMEEEYGYLADEQHLSGASRAEFLSGLKKDFDNDWPYPEEINHAIQSHRAGSKQYYATEYGGGQVRTDAKRVNEAFISDAALKFVLDSWEKYQLKPVKEVPEDVLNRLEDIFGGLDNETAMAHAVAVIEGRGGTRRKRSGQQRLTAFRRPHPTVPVRTHLRKVG